jgi:glycosyltransferase involved in cell wall biosynthesis
MGLKKLLIISYYWPPAGGPGVQRWVKLSKYLAQSGYQCHVVTVDEKFASYPALDTTLQGDVHANVHVTKTKSFEALKIFSALFRKEKVPYAGIPDKSRMSLAGKLALYIRSNFFIPDARKGWNKYALQAAAAIIEKEKIDVLITTSPPHSTQLAGLALKKKYPQLRWIADLRDPWTDIYYYDRLAHTTASKKKDLALERNVLEKADQLCTVSKDLQRIYSGKASGVGPDKIMILANGFDEADFAETPVARNEVFTIMHTGTINSNYNLSGFISAVQQFARTHPLRIKFIGNTDPIIHSELEKLGGLAELIPYVPHREITAHMRSADVLLLAIPDNRQNKGILTGKLFEYLAARKPILGLGPADGDAAAIVNECAAGRMFAYDESGKMMVFLDENYSRWKNGGTTLLNGEAYKKYSRRELAAQFARLLD